MQYFANHVLSENMHEHVSCCVEEILVACECLTSPCHTLGGSQHLPDSALVWEGKALCSLMALLWAVELDKWSPEVPSNPSPSVVLWLDGTWSEAWRATSMKGLGIASGAFQIASPVLASYESVRSTAVLGRTWAGERGRGSYRAIGLTFVVGNWVETALNPKLSVCMDKGGILWTC